MCSPDEIREFLAYLPRFHLDYAGLAMVDSSSPILPEVRLVKPGEIHRLCQCGRCMSLPDSDLSCSSVLVLHPARQQHLLLCRCGRSAQLPYCDGSHNPPAAGLLDKWRRFFGRD